MASTGVNEEPFPAPSRQANGEVNGIPTEVSSTSFADRIVVTISQDGRLAQWVRTQPSIQLKTSRINAASRSKSPSRRRRRLSWKWPFPVLNFHSFHQCTWIQRRWLVAEARTGRPWASCSPRRSPATLR